MTSDRQDERLHLEDLLEGHEIALGEWTPGVDEIVAFAQDWDPQYFHTDPEAATQSAFGGLIASGWHSAMVWRRMYAEAVLNRAAVVDEGGIEELRWFVPTRPGDVLRGRMLVLRTEDGDGAGHGRLRYQGELRNQRDEIAMRVRGETVLARRVPAA